MLSIDKLESLAVFDEGNTRIASVGVNICLYIEPPLHEIADEVLSVYNTFLDICPKNELVWYETESMERHEKVNSRTLDMPKTWLTSAKKNKEFLCFELKNTFSERHAADAPDWMFRFTSYSRDSDEFNEDNYSNFIEFLFPCHFIEDKLSAFYDFTQFICNTLPFISGVAGYTFAVSDYFRHIDGYKKPLSLSMRYKEIGISDEEFGESDLKNPARIMGVNWLTLLGKELAEQIELNVKHKHLSFVEVKHGLIAQAGDRPVVVDGNRGETVPAYQEAYELLQSFIVDEVAPLDVAGDFEERKAKTLQWLHRFKKDE